MTRNEKLAALRTKMREHHLDAWLIPSADPHLSEYLPEHWQTRAWFSGFTGSVGTVVVTQNAAALWADSRYWEQAEQQLSGSEIVLEKLGLGRNHIDWLLEKLPENSCVGVAADTLSLAEHNQLCHQFAAKNMVLNMQYDLAGALWTDRPALPVAPIYCHAAEFVSHSAAEKLARVRDAMREHGVQQHFISALDDIAWLTNLRGNDVVFNPVFLAHLLIDAHTAVLFVDKNKLSTEVQAALNAAEIAVQPYEAAGDALAQLSGSLLLEANKTAMSLLQRLPENVQIVDKILPSTLFKGQKTPQDIAHIRQAMLQDGVALCGFFADLEHKLAQHERITECDIDTMLYQHRSTQPHFVSASFDTIAGFNANGAMPHYRAEPETCSVIEGNGLLLIDSGAQYFNGTTDITRVIPIGTTTTAQKRDFTLVLKAHIALATAVFPENIASPLLDTICRKPLWQAQCDYGHGTGHGVGYFLNVHEGPQRIAHQAPVMPHHAMKVGMLTSNEPGLYRAGQWGIRIENLVVNQKVEQPQENAFGTFLYFETITLCPIDTRLVLPEMLSMDEREWLNTYHKRVRHELENHVEGAAKAWLIARTAAI
ncbi:MAG: aminopeptidase P family protein [Alysiella sp.]|uniref:aminopeptidase P family protein n=1 Tax=Alysiella sp. TaxID=1872483 RepID=UPI0026DBA740|nr:aminopeptidase P family protein [Alysiella sp.]MDO4433480.1 aminopeptidase P family protein [Alysiella sp.]